MGETTRYDSNEQRWWAVMNRDQAADGCFFYGVTTTGIFCRPGCSSRLPNRDHVEFFIDCRAARTAGYRPCLKCRPTDDSVHDALLQKIIIACRQLERSDCPQDLHTLAAQAGLSPSHFHRLFKRLVGITPKQYAMRLRLQRFQEGLAAKESITDALYQAGYASSSRVYTNRGDLLGMKPKEYRAGGSGCTISYGIAECWLGLVIVAATDRGVCAIEIGDDPVQLLRQVQDRFPKARFEEGTPVFTRIIKAVVELIKAPRSFVTVPLDIQGTSFQQQVWNIIRQIKPGDTMTYTDIAEKINKPRAVRAVAAACAANKLAVVVPCHRVIGKNGSMCGYRWDVKRKKRLLDNERE